MTCWWTAGLRREGRIGLSNGIPTQKRQMKKRDRKTDVVNEVEKKVWEIMMRQGDKAVLRHELQNMSSGHFLEFPVHRGRMHQEIGQSDTFTTAKKNSRPCCGVWQQEKAAASSVFIYSPQYAHSHTMNFLEVFLLYCHMGSLSHSQEPGKRSEQHWRSRTQHLRGKSRK